MINIKIDCAYVAIFIYYIRHWQWKLINFHWFKCWMMFWLCNRLDLISDRFGSDIIVFDKLVFNPNANGDSLLVATK